MLKSDAPKNRPTNAPELETNSNKPDRSTRLMAVNDRSLNETRTLLKTALQSQIELASNLEKVNGFRVLVNVVIRAMVHFRKGFD